MVRPFWLRLRGRIIQKTREGCGCPKFLAGKVFGQISTLLENSSPIFRQHEMLSLPRFGHFPARKTAAGKLAAPSGTLLDFLLRDRGPKPQKCPKWLGQGAKGVLDPRSKGLPESFAPPKPCFAPVQLSFAPVQEVCGALGPKDLLHPVLTTFRNFPFSGTLPGLLGRKCRPELSGRFGSHCEYYSACVSRVGLSTK